MEQSFSGIKTYLHEIGRQAIPTKEEEYDLFERLHQGDESMREQIVTRNLRLVVRLARQFRNKGLPMEDLIQEGNIGLLDVIDRFDHKLGYRFSTYAAFWIRQSIQVAIRKQGSLIRLPVRKARMLGQINDIMQEYQSSHGRAPTTLELAERFDIGEKQVEELFQMAQTKLSLDSPIDEEGTLLSDRVADFKTPSPTDQTIERETTRKLDHVLGQLSEREHSVLALRFGLKGRRPKSLRTVSRRVGLSQEGVRRVEKRALSKLSRTGMRQQLAGLL